MYSFKNYKNVLLNKLNWGLNWATAMDYQVLLKELEQNLQLGLTWGTVPVKSKMTLDPRISKLERLEFWDTRIKSRVSSFQFWGLRSKVFMWNYFCTITQPFRNLHCRSVVAVQCTITVWIASFDNLSINVNRYFRFRRFILHVQFMYPLLAIFQDFHR